MSSALTRRLSEPERAAVAAFEAQLAPLKVEVLHAIWYVREHQLDATKAAKAFVASQVWRKAERVDEIMRTPTAPTDELNALLDDLFKPRLLDGVDRHGRPVFFSALAVSAPGSPGWPAFG